MNRRNILLLLTLPILTIACGSDGNEASNDSSPKATSVDGGADGEALDLPKDQASQDGGTDAAPTVFDPLAPFTDVITTALTEVRALSVRDDELELFFVRDHALYRVTRANLEAEFGAEQAILAASNDPSGFSGVALSRDGLSLYTHYQQRATGPGTPPPTKFYRMNRSDTNGNFGEPTALDKLDVRFGISVADLQLRFDGQALYMQESTGLYMGKVKGFDGVELDNDLANLPRGSRGLAPSNDGVFLYLGYSPDFRVGGENAELRVTVMSRAVPSEHFSTAREISVAGHEVGVDDRPCWISADQSRLYFLRGNGLGATVHIASRAW